MGKSLHFSEPHCPSLKNEAENTTSIMGLVRGCGAMRVKQVAGTLRLRNGVGTVLMAQEPRILPVLV